MPEVVLQAPLSGWSMPLAEVPDPVFSQGLAGQGFALDPLDNQLRAPCSGEVVQLHRCLHALTLKREDGLEVLMHVGIDSVQLGGQGFQPRVALGDRVQTGQLLLEFDVDLVAQRCRSLITVVLIPENPSLQKVSAPTGQVEQGQAWMRLQLQGESAASVVEEGRPEQPGNWLVLPNPSGMHARPAARLIGLVKELPGQVWLECQRDNSLTRATARSLVSILGLGLERDARVRVVHTDLSESQLRRLEDEISSGLGDDLSAPVVAVSAAPPPAPAAPPADGIWRGVCASPGLGVGQLCLWKRATFDTSAPSRGPEAERTSLDQAWRDAASELKALERQAPPAEQGIFVAQAEILEDPDIRQAVLEAIQTGNSAARSWQQAIESRAASLEQLSNPLLAARANDLRDVGDRVLARLLGVESARRHFAEDTVVVARDLTPSDTVQLDPQRVKALVLAQGGPTSHVAILARSLGIPSLCAVGPALLELAEGATVLVDALEGRFYPQPQPEQLQAARERIQSLTEQAERERQQAHQPALTRDGASVEVAVNIGDVHDLQRGLEAGAEAVGLFRTEFYFHHCSQEPGLEEQQRHYDQLAQALGPERRLVARLLDVGGDKPLPYVPMPHEENPFLGIRGIRLFEQHPQLFRRQIEALLHCVGQCRLAIMVPMISSLREWRAIRAEILQLAQGRKLELGVMIEVPSAALLAEKLAPEVDFFSIGTNDLTQYTLAIDRGHSQLAGEVDALHPAMLQLIQRVGEAAQRHGRWVGVCGGAAQDPDAIPLLLGLNVRELSCSAPAIAAVKAEVRRWSLQDCQELARAALDCGEAQEVRQLVRGRRSS